ncbi:MAG: lysophospholipase [Oligoflexia bacterium]|nr:lysophospholipase [Oligoflexia bacterium]
MSSSAESFRQPLQQNVNDPSILEYLKSYGFPVPPDIRYEWKKIDTKGKKDRVSVFSLYLSPIHTFGTIVCVHGFGEHSGNYANLANDFIKNHYSVLFIDLRGHGLSEGPRGHADHANTYAEDLETALNLWLATSIPNHPLFLWGHSMGALASLQLISREKIERKFSAAVLTSPFLGFPEVKGFQKLLFNMAPLMGKITPTMPVAHNISPKTLSHDEEYLALRNEDPLISKVATPQWLCSMKTAIHEIHQQTKSFQEKTPTLLLLAGHELVTNLSQSRSFAIEAYIGTRHKVIEFPHCYHELEKEPSIRDRIVKESISWINSHK